VNVFIANIYFIHTQQWMCIFNHSVSPLKVDSAKTVTQLIELQIRPSAFIPLTVPAAFMNPSKIKTRDPLFKLRLDKLHFFYPFRRSLNHTLRYLRWSFCNFRINVRTTYKWDILNKLWNRLGNCTLLCSLLVHKLLDWIMKVLKQ